MKNQSKNMVLAAMIAGGLIIGGVPVDAGVRVVRRGPRRVVVVSKPRPVRKVVFVSGKPAALVDFNVTPKATKIWVDGSYRGTCAEFDGHPQKMVLRPGTYHIKLVTPDDDVIHRDVTVQAGYEVNLKLDL